MRSSPMRRSRHRKSPTTRHRVVAARPAAEARHLIARRWRGETRPEDADAYQRVLETTGVRDYLATPGNRGVWLLRRERAAGRTEFALLTLWDRRASIAAFAGNPIDLARYYDTDRDYLLDFRKTVEHFEVAGAWGEAWVASAACEPRATGPAIARELIEEA